MTLCRRPALLDSFILFWQPAINFQLFCLYLCLYHIKWQIHYLSIFIQTVNGKQSVYVATRAFLVLLWCLNTIVLFVFLTDSVMPVNCGWMVHSNLPHLSSAKYTQSMPVLTISSSLYLSLCYQTSKRLRTGVCW